jgi:hypothetical protein
MQPQQLHYGFFNMTTPNLKLKQSIVGVTSGSVAATAEQANIGILDLHDHSEGKGVKIPSGAININSELGFNNNGASNLKFTAFTSQNDNIESKNTLYCKGGELYYIDFAGNSVQITNNGYLYLNSLIGGSVFLDGGNSRGADLSLGTKDAYSFSFKTNDVNRFTISSNGLLQFDADWGIYPTSNNSPGDLHDVTVTNSSYLRLTGSATSVSGFISGGASKILLLTNQTGTGIIIKNEGGSSSASFRIVTGTGNDISLANNASALFVYNENISRWSLLTGAATSATLVYPNADVNDRDSTQVFTAADNRVQVCTPTSHRIYTLPSLGISKGDTWTIHNRGVAGAATIAINSSNTDIIDFVLPLGMTKFIALVDSPTSNTDWGVIEARSEWTDLNIQDSNFVDGFGVLFDRRVFFRREGRDLVIKGRITSGTVPAREGTMILPQIGSTQLTWDIFPGLSAQKYAFGVAQRIPPVSSTPENLAGYTMAWIGSPLGTTMIQLAANVGNSLYISNNCRDIIDSGDAVGFINVVVPITQFRG